MLFLAVFQIFEETSKFKRTNIGEWKVLNHLTQREKRICLLKSLDDHDEISEKDEKIFICIRFYTPGVVCGPNKIHRAFEDGITSF